MHITVQKKSKTKECMFNFIFKTLKISQNNWYFRQRIVVTLGKVTEWFSTALYLMVILNAFKVFLHICVK